MSAKENASGESYKDTRQHPHFVASRVCAFAGGGELWGIRMLLIRRFGNCLRRPFQRVSLGVCGFPFPEIVGADKQKRSEGGKNYYEPPDERFCHGCCKRDHLSLPINTETWPPKISDQITRYEPRQTPATFRPRERCHRSLAPPENSRPLRKGRFKCDAGLRIWTPGFQLGDVAQIRSPDRLSLKKSYQMQPGDPFLTVVHAFMVFNIQYQRNVIGKTLGSRACGP
jgi:hypothetical protein